MESLCRGGTGASNFTRSTCLTRLGLLQKASQDDAKFIATTPEVIQAIPQSLVLGTSPEIRNERLQAMFIRLVVCNGLLKRVQWVRRA